MAPSRRRVLGTLLLVGAGSVPLVCPPRAHAQETPSTTPVDSARVVAVGFSLGTHDFGLLLEAVRKARPAETKAPDRPCAS